MKATILELNTNSICIEIPTDLQNQAWEESAKFPTESSRQRAYINLLCQKIVLSYLQEEVVKSATIESNCQNHWILGVNGSAIELGEQRLIIIPSEALLVDELRVPQEWVDIPELAGDYYLGVNVDTEENLLQIWGYTTHKELKERSDYTHRDRSYSVDREEVTEDVDSLWLIREYYPEEPTRTKIVDLPTLSSLDQLQLLATLSNRDLIFPRRAVTFEKWGALFADTKCQQILVYLRNYQIQPVAYFGLPIWQWLKQVISKLEEQISLILEEQISVIANNSITYAASIELSILPTGSENCEFEKLNINQLHPYHTVPQFADNQWVPRYLLKHIIENGLSLSDVQPQIEEYKRMEFRRALINSPQIAINRAYLYNEKTLYENYSELGSEREAFKELLNNSVIVPFLFSEDTPIQPPKFTTNSFEEWKKICEEIKMKCVRLSWDDDENQDEIEKRFVRPFHSFSQNISTGNIDLYIRDLGLSESAKEPFKQQLRAIRNKCIELEDLDKRATREELYQSFVTVEGTQVVEGRYDRCKPFASEIKQLIDLKYNINLPDALNGFTLTPYESLSRSVLQENERQEKRDKSKEKNADIWFKMLQNLTFDQLQNRLYLESNQQEGYLDSLSSLKLSEVLEVRAMDEWTQYICSIENLLKNPEDFQAMSEKVYKDYIGLNQRITNLVTQNRSGEPVAKWTPGIEYILEMAGVRMSVKWSHQKGFTYALNGEVPSNLAKRQVPYIEKLRIAGVEENQADLNATIEIKRGFTTAPGEQWKALSRKIPEIQGFQLEKATVENDATLNLPGDE